MASDGSGSSSSGCSTSVYSDSLSEDNSRRVADVSFTNEGFELSDATVNYATPNDDTSVGGTRPKLGTSERKRAVTDAVSTQSNRPFKTDIQRVRKNITHNLTDHMASLSQPSNRPTTFVC